MHILYNQPAEAFSTFRLHNTLSEVILIDELSDLALVDAQQPPVIIGEGSNTIFLASQVRPLLRFLAKSRTVTANNSQHLELHVEAGHNWHELVTWAVTQQLWGIENLALIPGSVGAAPVQNIGAYGVEFSDVCRYVDFYDWQERKVIRLDNNACQFAYRDSVFKQQLQGKGIIVAVGLVLFKDPKPVVTYPGLDTLPPFTTLEEIYQQVIAIRQAKLPDYKVIANCGSFFKNPVISESQYQLLQSSFAKIPGFSVESGIKVPAAWLIDQAGFKGYKYQNLGCYERQPLVLVNYGGAEGPALLVLINLIRKTIETQFGILLEPEVRLLDSNGQHYVES
ncbi:UDP-N-acetylmuramate dehydrogenase [Alishewanella sp. d11]|uniref:UDP-N-acetylmuramate dehydrogenase n=1 Tax=Alishewanella sp. d11 TaxID=3414030 RepID=UPI003BF885D1